MALALHGRMGILQDVRFAIRVLARKPSFAIIVVLTLALGIGAGSAMFSIVHSLLLRPLDLPDLDRAVAVQSSERGQIFDNSISAPALDEYQKDAKSFSRIAGYGYWDTALTGNGGDPEEILAAKVSPGFFDLLAVQPRLGRWPAQDEVGDGNDKVAVLSSALWQRRFGGDAAILGKKVTLAGRDYTVIGVMPDLFNVPTASELWVPLTFTPKQIGDRNDRGFGTVARLAPGATLASADAELRQAGERDATIYPSDKGVALRVTTLVRGMSDDYTRNFVITLFGAALLVLLIACANVANLFLAHALSRRKELAVRAALGAGRGRVIRQLLTEAIVLGLAGGLASLLFASWAIDAVHGALPRTTVRFVPGWDSMSVNPTVLGFAILVGILVGVVFGIVPALQVSRPDVGTILKDEGRGTTGAAHTHRLRAILVCGQIALALVLLLGAGAMTKGFIRLASPGNTVDIDHALTFRTSLPPARYPKQSDIPEFQRRVLDRLHALPGVEDAAITNNVFWGNHGWEKDAYPEDRVLTPDEQITIDYRAATPGYPQLLRVPLLIGRGIEARDDEQALRVAVVSRVAAHRLWPDADPIGKRFRWSRDDKEPWLTVVGVVGDVSDRIDVPPPGTIYTSYAQDGPRSMTFVVRTETDPLAMAHAAESTVFAVDPGQPVFEIRTLRVVLQDRMAGVRIGSGLMGVFALLALVLAAIGIYGVVATLVTQRTHEIGIRMALGAQRRDVLRLILGKGVLLTLVGLVVGLALGFGLVRLMSGVLPAGIIDGDSSVFIVFTAAVAGIAFFGSLVPALRATRVDPLQALRD